MQQDLRRCALAGLSAVALSLSLAAPAMAEELHIYAWSSELPDEVVQDFAKATGIDATVDTFDSNESLIAKLEAGASGYDIINPSQYAVQILVKKGLVEPLDHTRLPGLANLSEVFRTLSYDSGNQYSLPYIWGTTGFAYNSDCVTEPVTSWKALWDPKYKDRIYMLDNMLAAYIAALQINGYSATSANPDEIAKATRSLIEQKPILGGYNSTNFADLVSSGEACLVEAWSGNVIQAMADNPKVHYVLPDEGGTMWIDGYSVARNAPNRDAAYKFLDYLLQPEVAAKVTRLVKVANTNAKAKALLPPDITGNPAIYPPEERLKKAEFILDHGEAMKFYQDGWTQVKAAQ
ncbi:spermidine/putrescine transport system substrate-binding protein [Inquilinus ginsengisoli]|uniref:Putrescine-binding periplasmic protein n=1 Tax=Inquilinus ginsengisoli TaxID=363840 RepID=A0ABU1JJ66_9PROT|nr:spermidine/putrescine ABC transporter substrate-binding protein [Inquilinus ginsengisoli]MDR6288643.1 spermidine/putrescine transport system substrate-binding protein [Inquilinus ginsengisoli]